MDNHYGKGMYELDGEPQFVINQYCPLHGEGPEEWLELELA